MRSFPKPGRYELERVGRLVRVHAFTGPGFDPRPCAVASVLDEKVAVETDHRLWPSGLSGSVVFRTEVIVSGEDARGRLGQLKDAVRQALR